MTLGRDVVAGPEKRGGLVNGARIYQEARREEGKIGHLRSLSWWNILTHTRIWPYRTERRLRNILDERRP